MRIEIENCLGIERAELEVEAGEVVSVIGPNAAGKTSFAVAAAAVLGAEANPLGVSVADVRSVYLRDGASEGSAALYVDQSVIEWNPRQADIAVGGNVHLSRPECLGLVDLTARRGAKERAKLLQDILLPPADTVLEELRTALEERLPERDVIGVVEEVSKRGWESAAKVYEGRMQEAKRSWCNVTGRRQWGVKIASDWHPDGWLAEWDGTTVEAAEARLAEARGQRDVVLRVRAVDEAVLLAAEQARAALPALEAELETARQAEAEAKAEGESARARHQGFEATIGARTRDLAGLDAQATTGSPGPDVLQCPHCGGAVKVIGTGDIGSPSIDFELVEWVEPSQDEREAAAERLAEVRKTIQGLLDEATLGRDRAKEELDVATGAWRIADTQLKDVVSRLTQTRTAAEVSGEARTELTEHRREQAERAVSEAEAAIGKARAYREARGLNETVLHYTDIVRVIGPTGVRAQLLEGGHRRLNAGAAALASAAGWPAVTIGDDSMVRVAGRPAPLCSESERWRAQAVLQVTLAALTKSPAVVIDRADLLDPAGYAGLVAMAKLATSKVPVAIILCATGEPSRGRPVAAGAHSERENVMSAELDLAVESIDVGRWSRCEREALHGGGERAGRVPVARVVAQ